MGGLNKSQRSPLFDVLLIAAVVLALICACAYARAATPNPSAVRTASTAPHFDGDGYPDGGTCYMLPDGSVICDGNPGGGGEVCIVSPSGKVICYDPDGMVRRRWAY
jgi:hypothetical protein